MIFMQIYTNYFEITNFLAKFIIFPCVAHGFFIIIMFMFAYSILPYFISTPSLSYCLRLPVGGSVSVMRTTAVRDKERVMLWSKASMC